MPEILFLGAGDVGPVHGPTDGYPVERYTELVRPTLAAADLRFGNCERQYSDRGTKNEYSPHGCQPPSMARIFDDCGFELLSLANNHMFDFGPDALMDTRALMESKGMAVAGAGRNLEEARRPAIVTCQGIRVGLLAYCSILTRGGVAGPDTIGIAPLRADATVESRGPNAPARVHTTPNAEDLAMVIEDVKALRPQVDVLLVSFHWGVIWVPRVIADYQVTAGHAAIDAGADMILGHHAHIPKGIEMYRGKPIFYSLSNFCMTKPFPSEHWAETPWLHGALRNHADQDPEYPILPYGADAKRTLLARAILTKDGVKEVSFLPMLIDKLYRPEVLKAGDPRFAEAVRYMDWASEGLDHKFTVRGDAVIVTPA